MITWSEEELTTILSSDKFNEDYKVLQVGNWFEKINKIQINKIPNF